MLKNTGQRPLWCIVQNESKVEIFFLTDATLPVMMKFRLFGFQCKRMALDKSVIVLRVVRNCR